MTISQLGSLLSAAGFNVTFGSAPNGTETPYVVLTDITNPNFAADNKTYAETTSLRVKLIESEAHDWTLISALKAVLDGASLRYSVTYLESDSEHVCESYYDIRFLGGIS